MNEIHLAGSQVVIAGRRALVSVLDDVERGNELSPLAITTARAALESICAVAEALAAPRALEGRTQEVAGAQTLARESAGAVGAQSAPAPTVTDYLAWLTEWDRAECERRMVTCIIAPREVESLARFLAKLNAFAGVGERKGPA